MVREHLVLKRERVEEFQAILSSMLWENQNQTIFSINIIDLIHYCCLRHLLKNKSRAKQAKRPFKVISCGIKPLFLFMKSIRNNNHNNIRRKWSRRRVIIMLNATWHWRRGKSLNSQFRFVTFSPMSPILPPRYEYLRENFRFWKAVLFVWLFTYRNRVQSCYLLSLWQNIVLGVCRTEPNECTSAACYSTPPACFWWPSRGTSSAWYSSRGRLAWCTRPCSRCRIYLSPTTIPPTR